MQFKDNRPEAAIQLQLREAANNHGQKGAIAQLKAWGNGPVTQLRSTIEYNTTEFDLENNSKEIVGQKMVAHLESGDPLKGSAPGSGVQAGLMNGLKDAGYRRMIRGHLLNGQFGGLGVAFNLYPITAKANSLHKNYVENHVKSYLTEGKDINYTVEVQNAQNKVSAPNAEFKCVAEDDKTKKVLIDQVISSVPSQSAQSKNSLVAEGSQNNNTISRSFPTRNLKKGLGEKGKGFVSVDKDHEKTSSRISSIKFNEDEQIVSSDEEIGKRKLLDLNQFGGRSFLDGGINRVEYALELVASYEEIFEDSKLYIKGKGYDSTELTDWIDTASEEELNQIISRLEGVT